MTRWATLFVMLMAPGAFAQTTTLPFTIRTSASTTVDEYTFGAADCDTTLTLTWTLNSASGSYTNGNMKFWATALDSCGDAAATGDLTFDSVPASSYLVTPTGTFTVTISDLPGFATTSCGAANLTSANRVCGAYTYLASTYASSTSVAQASSLKLTYDTEPPASPTIVSVAAYDGTARITFSADSDVATVGAQVMGPNDSTFASSQTADGSATVLEVAGLTNGLDYQLRLVGWDAASNESLPSEAVTVNPRKTLGFYGVYRAAGGTDTGCTSVPGSFPLLGLLLAVRSARVRRGKR